MTYIIGTGKGARLTDEGRRVALRMLEAGMPRRVIAYDIGCSLQTLATLRRKFGMPVRSRLDRDGEDAEILRRLRLGQPQAQIVREVRVGFRRVKRVRDAHGIPPLPTGGSPGSRTGGHPRPPKLRDIALEPMKREPRPAHWGAPKPAPALKHLASGKTPWRCYCTPFGVPATGPTCPQCQTPAPWAELLEAA